MGFRWSFLRSEGEEGTAGVGGGMGVKGRDVEMGRKVRCLVDGWGRKERLSW